MGEFYSDYGAIDAALQRDLDRLKTQGIPMDVIFEQGTGAERGGVSSGQ